MSSRTSIAQPTVCFGHRTALQILRAAKPGELSPEKGAAPKLPGHAPRSELLRETLRRMEADHPGLRFEEPIHVLVGTPNCRAGKACRPHVCEGFLPGSALLRLDGDVAVCSPELALVQEARREKSEVALLELAWELCGSYRTRRTGMPPAYDVEPLTNVRALRGFVARNPSLGGARKVARILAYLADGSASARETKLALVMGLPLAKGGYGLGIPRMNFEVEAAARARAIAGRRSFRCDLCWPEAKLDVEYQSRESHEGELSRIRDSRRANALATMGWTVIGVTGDELDSLAATDAIAEAIRLRLGKRARTAVADHHARKLGLRRRLGLPARYV